MNRLLKSCFSFILLFSILFSGCSLQERPAGAPASKEINPVTITIAAARDSQQAALSAVKLTAQELERISGGLIKTKVVESRSIQNEFLRGTELILMDNSMLSSYVPYLNMLSSEFMFTGYDHMSVSLNSPAVLNSVGAELKSKNGYRPLAALYSGSWSILSKGMIYSAGDLRNTRTSISQSGTSDIFLRAYSVKNSEQPMTIADKDIDWIEVKTSMGPKAFPYEGAKYLIDSFHRVDTAWLLVNDSFYNSLDNERKAAIKEVSAYLRECHDSEYLRLEKDYSDTVEEAGIWPYSYDFEEIRSDYFYRYSQEMYESPLYNEAFHYRIDSLSYQY